MSPWAEGSPADLNGDSRVDLRDYSALSAGWLRREVLRREDLSRDGATDFADLAAFTSWWLWSMRR